eukprot:gene10257-12132_t
MPLPVESQIQTLIVKHASSLAINVQVLVQPLIELRGMKPKEAAESERPAIKALNTSVVSTGVDCLMAIYQLAQNFDKAVGAALNANPQCPALGTELLQYGAGLGCYAQYAGVYSAMAEVILGELFVGFVDHVEPNLSPSNATEALEAPFEFVGSLLAL